MADHAVGGVDRLVEGAARQAEAADPEGRRHDPVGEVLRQALDRGPADGRLVEAVRVAPDDHRHGPAPPLQAARAQGRLHGGDVLVQAALRRQAGADQAEEEQGGEGAGEPRQRRDGEGGRADRGEEQRQREAAGAPPPARRAAVETALQGGDQPADPGDRVTGRPVERVGIAGRRLDPEGDGEDGERVGKRTGQMDHSVWSVPAREVAPIAHGGDLGGLRQAFPDAPEPWLDLSTGINPVPYRVPALEASAWTRLPEAAEVRALREAAAAAYGAPDADHVVPAPGTQILIETLPRLLAPTEVAVVGPTYAEHAAAWAPGRARGGGGRGRRRPRRGPGGGARRSQQPGRADPPAGRAPGARRGAQPARRPARRRRGLRRPGAGGEPVPSRRRTGLGAGPRGAALLRQDLRARRPAPRLRGRRARHGGPDRRGPRTLGGVGPRPARSGARPCRTRAGAPRPPGPGPRTRAASTG